MTTIATDLEHLRLTLRARRLEQVVAALRERRRYQASTGAVLAPLERSIADFCDELRAVETRLRSVETSR